MSVPNEKQDMSTETNSKTRKYICLGQPGLKEMLA